MLSGKFLVYSWSEYSPGLSSLGRTEYRVFQPVAAAACQIVDRLSTSYCSHILIVCQRLVSYTPLWNQCSLAHVTLKQIGHVGLEFDGCNQDQSELISQFLVEGGRPTTRTYSCDLCECVYIRVYSCVGTFFLNVYVLAYAHNDLDCISRSGSYACIQTND